MEDAGRGDLRGSETTGSLVPPQPLQPADWRRHQSPDLSLPVPRLPSTDHVAKAHHVVAHRPRPVSLSMMGKQTCLAPPTSKLRLTWFQRISPQSRGDSGAQGLPSGLGDGARGDPNFRQVGGRNAAPARKRKPPVKRPGGDGERGREGSHGLPSAAAACGHPGSAREAAAAARGGRCDGLKSACRASSARGGEGAGRRGPAEESDQPGRPGWCRAPGSMRPRGPEAGGGAAPRKPELS